MALQPNQVLISSVQTAEKSILDINGKQAYLGQQFVATTNLVAISDTTEDALLYLNNPAINSKALFCYLRKLNVASTSVVVTFRMYINPTSVSSGSTITPVNCRPASGVTSVASCKLQPTVGGNGTLVTAIATSYTYLQNDSGVMIILDPGQSMLVTQQAASNTSVVAEAVWYEL